MTPPPPIQLEEAQRRLLADVVPLEAEEVAAADTSGRYLAAPLLARRTQPAADLSAMDGYAMRADDLAGPWRVVGESAAGHPFSGLIEAGEAIRISTGALMPDGKGVVLLQENAMRDGGTLSLNGEGEPTPRHIRRRGFDFAEGEELLPAGTRIGPAQLALAIAGGHAALPVHRLPRVAVLDSGDELAADPSACAPHQIPASNGAMLAAMAAPLASNVERIGPVADDLPAFASALRRSEGADVLVTSGGASVGDHDLLQPALAAWGAKTDFWRVAMKPGKPLLVARRGAQFIVGLPGNPVSSYVTAFLFLMPLLRALAGAADPLPRPAPMRLAGELPAGGSRLEFIRASCAVGTVAPILQRDSSAMRALALADALIVHPAGAPARRNGEEVQVYMLGNGCIA
jgi:molybdopterin molybdotransferase